jgi:hypothetical protein
MDDQIQGWAIIELMGHRVEAGEVRNAGGLLRIDLAGPKPVTKFYGPSALYCVSLVDEATVNEWVDRNAPRPAARYELVSDSTHRVVDDLDDDDFAEDYS